MTCKTKTKNKKDQIRRKFVDLAWKMFKMHQETSDRLWNIFEMEFYERIRNDKKQKERYVDESQIPF